MAYDYKKVFYLSSTLNLDTAFDAGDTYTKAIDLSAFVNSTGVGKTKATGLGIYKVHMSITDASDNRPVDAGETGVFRVGVFAGLGEDSTNYTLSTHENTASNDLNIWGSDWYGGGAGASGNNAQGTNFLAPSEDVPYIVVRENMAIVATCTAPITQILYVNMRFECSEIPLTSDTLTQLLRTQTA